MTPIPRHSRFSIRLATLIRYVLALSRSGGRWDEAVAIFDRAQKQGDTGNGHKLVDAKFDPARPDWIGMKAIAHYILGTRSPRHGPADPKEQKAHLEAALRVRPDLRPPTQRELGDAALLRSAQEQERQGKIREAISAYKLVVYRADGETKRKAVDALRRLEPKHQER